MKFFHYNAALLFFISLFLFKKAYTQKFEVLGKITGVSDNSYAILYYFDNDLNDSKGDTALIKNGRFKFSGKVIGAYSAIIAVETKEKKNSGRYVLFIEPGKINVTINDIASSKINVRGSIAHKEYESLQKELLFEKTEFKKISDSSRVIDSLLINALIDDTTAKKLKANINKNVPALYSAEIQKEIAYMKTHPDSYVSLMSLSYFIGRNPNDSIDAWYASISDKVKGGNEDKNFLKRYLKYRKAISAEYPFDKLQLQESAPGFSIYDNKQKDTLGLKDFKGKIIVLELWGISCVPCLYSNLELEKIRNKYNNDQIKIISLAKTFPGDIGPIQSYIKKNKFNNWLHVVLNNDANEDLGSLLEGDFSKYIGLGIPRTIIIDQEGKLAYKSYGYSESQVAEVDKLIGELIHRHSK